MKEIRSKRIFGPRHAWVVLPLLVVSFAAVVAAAAPASASPEKGVNPGKLIHIVVALCDNKYQGIVPVPAKIGNGDDPANNLYWGAAYGVKTFFLRAKDWALISCGLHPKPGVLERCLFKHRSKAVYLVADAYRGRDIRKSTYDFLRFAGGRDMEVLESREEPKPIRLYAGGAADLVAYVGHNGLMDFSLSDVQGGTSGGSRSAIILACASKPYFAGLLRKSGASPLLWTTNLMAPEAYTLKAAVDGWLLGETGEAIRRRAAEAYNQHQSCGMNAALKLFSTGW